MTPKGVSTRRTLSDGTKTHNARHKIDYRRTVLCSVVARGGVVWCFLKHVTRARKGGGGVFVFSLTLPREDMTRGEEQNIHAHLLTHLPTPHTLGWIKSTSSSTKGTGGHGTHTSTTDPEDHAQQRAEREEHAYTVKHGASAPIIADTLTRPLKSTSFACPCGDEA